MISKIYPINILIILAILMPNILFFILKPINIPNKQNKTLTWVIVGVFENSGRILAFVLPLFWSVKLTDKNKIVTLILMGMLLIIYYLGWIRYFSSKREYKLLFEPMFFIPLPMAICPILFLLLLGFLIESWPMVIASLIFGIGHISESLRIWLALL